MRVMVVYGTSDRELELRSIVFTGGYGSSGAGLFISNGARVELLMCSIEQNEGREDGGGISMWDSSTRVNLYGVSFSGNTSPDGPDIHRDGGIITVYTTCTLGGDVAVQGSALSTAGTVGGSKFSYTCGFHWVSTQQDLYNQISTSGTSTMNNGDTVTMASRTYEAGSAHNGNEMFTLDGLYGNINCVEDNSSCVLSGSGTRRIMVVQGTGGGVLTFRSLAVSNGNYQHGGGVAIEQCTQVVFVMCSFQDNIATTNGGGLRVWAPGGLVGLYGVSFSGNTSPNGADILTHQPGTGGTVTVYSTCSAGEN